MGYCTKCFVAGFVLSLSHFESFVIFDVSLVAVLALYPLNHHFSRWNAWSGVPLSLTILACVPLLGILVNKLSRRPRRVWAWRRAMRFMDEYRPGAPRAERYGWFGLMWAVLGLFCGTALVFLPFAMFVIHTFCLYMEPQDGLCSLSYESVFYLLY